MSGQNGVGTAPTFGQNMSGTFRNNMPGANSSSAPWWANTMQAMSNQTMQQQARPFAPGPAVRAGQPMQFNPSMFQQNASGPQIQQVPLPQPLPAAGLGYSAAPTTQFVKQNPVKNKMFANFVVDNTPKTTDGNYGS